MKIIAVLLAVLLLAGCGAQTPQEIQKPTEPVYTLPESLYTPEDFSYRGEYLTCTAGNAVMGIDVSSHQGEIDWAAVAEAGVKFVFVRLGYRGYTSGSLHIDEYAEQNLEGAKAAGLLVGAYFFSQAISKGEARAEADLAMQALKGFDLDLPLVYDWEFVSNTARTGNMDKETLTDCTLTFCQRVESRGYDPMVYFNSNQIKKLLDGQVLEQYPWWLAKYDLTLEFPCKVDMWQYTNEGQLPGISTKVDINLLFTDYGLGKTFFGETE